MHFRQCFPILICICSTEGNHHTIYEKMGAHAIAVRGVDGFLFAVWAPNAVRVSVVGTFNGWDGRIHPMRARGASGVWELFIPGIGSGELYKYEIRSADGSLHVKADPYAQCSEARPKTASITYAPGAVCMGRCRMDCTARRTAISLSGRFRFTRCISVRGSARSRRKPRDPDIGHGGRADCLREKYGIHPY